MSTDKTITDQDIRNLRTEAFENADYLQGVMCDLALEGEIDFDDYTVLEPDEVRSLANMTQAEALHACEKAIREARALHAEYAR